MAKIIIDVADTCWKCFYFKKGICQIFPDSMDGKPCIDSEVEKEKVLFEGYIDKKELKNNTGFLNVVSDKKTLNSICYLNKKYFKVKVVEDKDES